MVTDNQCRSILQFLTLERVMSASRFDQLLERITGSSTIDEEEIVNRINSRIADLNQTVARTNCELTGEKNVVLISTADPTASEIRSYFTKEQTTYFYHLMDNVVVNGGAISSTAALEMGSRVTQGKLTMSESEKVLSQFANKRLLTLEAGHVYLSPLTIAELKPYIVDNYAVDLCVFCKQIVVFGDKCHNCNVSIHRPCLADFKSGCKKSAKCPQCKREL